MQRIKKILVRLSLISLLLTNVLTLLNQSFHQMGFEVLKSAIDFIAPESVAKELISSSPAQTISKHKTVIQGVGKRVSNRTVKNALKNIADVPLEVVPLIGSGAVIALTISDIYDDCQTLKDINEINRAFDLDIEDEQTVCGFNISKLNKWK